MTRQEVLEQVVGIENKNILLTLPTGFGKTKLAIERIKSQINKGKILIVVPTNPLKITWQEEFNEWWSDCNMDLSFTTYISFPKYAGEWDYVIFDESHHLSDRCKEAIKDYKIHNSILLSATINDLLKEELKSLFSDLKIYNITLREAIDNEILPDPQVYLIPLKLDNVMPCKVIIRNPKAKGRTIYCSWKDKWKYIKQKNNPIHIYCTESQYIIDLNSQIKWYKNQYMRRRTPILKNRWLKLCGERLKFLSDCKTSYIHKILKYCDKERTLTFCNGIEQTELLGKYCINSKNKDSEKYLKDFNNGKINHITACNMLNEGMNLRNCKIGIYANLNSSETIVKQRAGRLLRHSEPIIIIPYYKFTREEELVNIMLENYNTDLVKTINFIEEIVL